MKSLNDLTKNFCNTLDDEDIDYLICLVDKESGNALYCNHAKEGTTLQLMADNIVCMHKNLGTPIPDLLESLTQRIAGNLLIRKLEENLPEEFEDEEGNKVTTDILGMLAQLVELRKEQENSEDD